MLGRKRESCTLKQYLFRRCRAEVSHVLGFGRHLSVLNV